MRNRRINVRVTEAEKEGLRRVVEKTGVPEAIIVREAVRSKILEIDRTDSVALGATPSLIVTPDGAR